MNDDWDDDSVGYIYLGKEMDVCMNCGYEFPLFGKRNHICSGAKRHR